MLEKALGSVGYSGSFLPKPDSPCIYLTGTVQLYYWIKISKGIQRRLIVFSKEAPVSANIVLKPHGQILRGPKVFLLTRLGP